MRKTPMHLSSHRQRVWKKIVRLHELVHGGNQTIPTMAQMEAIVAIVEFNLEKCPNWKIVGAVIFPLKPINAAHQIPNRILSTHVHTHSHNYIVPAEPQVTWSLKRLSPFYVFCGGDVERASWRPALRYKKKKSHNSYVRCQWNRMKSAVSVYWTTGNAISNEVQRNRTLNIQNNLVLFDCHHYPSMLLCFFGPTWVCVFVCNAWYTSRTQEWRSREWEWIEHVCMCLCVRVMCVLSATATVLSVLKAIEWYTKNHHHSIKIV